jgi:carbonic anhydrase/acetyltransferase-like protein (isoleucine patch superfamily)
MRIGKQVFIADSARLIGKIELGDYVSVWFGVVLRGDNDWIRIGSRSNIQDLSMIHVDPGIPVNIGSGVTVGHGAIIHGATIGDNTLIGMRSTILNHARIGRFCIIGAHSLVTENMEVPDFSVVMGTPGKVVKQLPEKVKEKLLLNAEHYVELSARYLAGENFE